VKSKCKNCSTEFKHFPSWSALFCSLKCRTEYWKKHIECHPRYLKDFDEKRVIKLYKGGKSTKEIASITGYKQITIQKRLKRLGLLRNIKDESKVQAELRTTKIKIPKPSEDYAWFLGVMCGDGWTVKDTRIGLNVRDKDFLDSFSNTVNELFGLEGKFSKREGYQVVFHSLNLVRYLENGFHGDNWHKDLHNPKFSFVLKDKKYFFAWLSGFFDSEGSAFFTAGLPKIQFAQVNEKGLKLIQKKLSEYGIRSGIGYLTKPSSRFSKVEISKENPLAKNIYTCGKNDAIELSYSLKSSLKRKEKRLAQIRKVEKINIKIYDWGGCSKRELAFLKQNLHLKNVELTKIFNEKFSRDVCGIGHFLTRNKVKRTLKQKRGIYLARKK